MSKSRFKALALLSGGLDSILAIKIIQQQNIDVEGIVFQSSFFQNKHIKEMAEQLNVTLHQIDITEEILNMLENPKYGFGKNLNPCIDCHIYMIKRAGEYLKTIHGDFLITGEVIGERPKSQNYNALHLIAKASGYGDILLRPLSAKKLKITEVEKKGMVAREKLLDISGRSRARQIELAKQYHIDYFPQPAGGCLLTVPSYSDRLRLSLKIKKMNKLDLELMKLGRHFIAHDNRKIIVSRDDKENQIIKQIVDDSYFLFELHDKPGPITIFCDSELTENDMITCASLTVRYSKFRQQPNVQVKYYKKSVGANNDSPLHIICVSAKDAEEMNLKLI